MLRVTTVGSHSGSICTRNSGRCSDAGIRSCSERKPPWQPDPRRVHGLVLRSAVRANGGEGTVCAASTGFWAETDTSDGGGRALAAGALDGRHCTPEMLPMLLKHPPGMHEQLLKAPQST
jgi:hypothetical protein